MARSWKSMDFPQRIAAAALALLAVIALVAALSGCGARTSGGAGAAGSTLSGPGASGNSTPQSSSSRGSSHHSSSSSAAHGSDSAGTVQLSDLPSQARDTVALIDDGGPYPYSRDGVVFGNYEHQLPKKPRGWYHEYTVPTPGASTRGARRLIQGKDGTLYYTADHYETFKKVLR